MSPVHHDHSADAALAAMASLPPLTPADAADATDAGAPAVEASGATGAAAGAATSPAPAASGSATAPSTSAAPAPAPAPAPSASTSRPSAARPPASVSPDSRPSGTGRRPRRGTLSLRVEWARQIRRRRTQIALGFMVALPLILAAAFTWGSDDAGPSTSSFIDLAQSSSANFVTVTLFFSSSFLLIVVVSLFFGDTIASEASWSSLKYLLAMPVPRLRLLRQKLVIAALLSALSLVVLVVVAALIGAWAYGNGPLATPTGVTFTGGEAWQRIGLVMVAVAAQLVWVAGLAFLMTVATNVPLGAVGTAVLLSIVSQILDQITALGDLRDWLPTHFSTAWTGALVDPVSWFDITRGAFQSVAYGAVFFVAAFLVFRRKDITS